MALLQTVLRSAALTLNELVCWSTTTKDSSKHQQGVSNKTRSVKTSGEALLIGHITAYESYSIVGREKQTTFNSVSYETTGNLH